MEEKTLGFTGRIIVAALIAKAKRASELVDIGKQLLACAVNPELEHVVVVGADGTLDLGIRNGKIANRRRRKSHHC